MSRRYLLTRAAGARRLLGVALCAVLIATSAIAGTASGEEITSGDGYDVFTVDTASPSGHSIRLDANSRYLFLVSGRYVFWALGGGVADAECSSVATDPVPQRHRYGYGSGDHTDLFIDGGVEWTPVTPNVACDPTSTYYLFADTGSKAVTVRFVIDDPNHADNVGHLTVAAIRCDDLTRCGQNIPPIPGIRLPGPVEQAVDLVIDLAIDLAQDGLQLAGAVRAFVEREAEPVLDLLPDAPDPDDSVQAVGVVSTNAEHDGKAGFGFDIDRGTYTATVSGHYWWGGGLSDGGACSNAPSDPVFRKDRFGYNLLALLINDNDVVWTPIEGGTGCSPSGTYTTTFSTHIPTTLRFRVKEAGAAGYPDNVGALAVTVRRHG